MRHIHASVVVRQILLRTAASAAAVACASSLTPALAALPDEMARCAAIAIADSRLACFDALALSVAKHAASAPPDATIVAPPAAARAAGAQGPVTLVPPKAIEARVERVLGGRSAGERDSLLLDNGQTWLLLEDGAEFSAGDSVTIKRAALGSFLLLTPAHRSYRVRRSQ
jgi:hypothetical protein